MYQFFSNERPSSNILFDISRGAITEGFMLHKFGANFDIDQADDPESVWTRGGLYPWASLATAQTIYCISTSGSDTGTLTIEGLDANYKQQTETITLTGATAVATTNTFIRVFRMTYGDGVNVGTITARVTSGAGTVVAQIDIGYAQTLMAVYTIPAGFTAYMSTFDTTIDGTKQCQMLMYQRLFDAPFRIAHIAEATGHYRYDFAAPFKIPEKTDIDIRINNVSGNDARVTANFDLFLLKN
jgi:hypothetical protein